MAAIAPYTQVRPTEVKSLFIILGLQSPHIPKIVESIRPPEAPLVGDLRKLCGQIVKEYRITTEEGPLTFAEADTISHEEVQKVIRAFSRFTHQKGDYQALVQRVMPLCSDLVIARIVEDQDHPVETLRSIHHRLCEEITMLIRLAKTPLAPYKERIGPLELTLESFQRLVAVHNELIPLAEQKVAETNGKSLKEEFLRIFKDHPLQKYLIDHRREHSTIVQLINFFHRVASCFYFIDWPIIGNITRETPSAQFVYFAEQAKQYHEDMDKRFQDLYDEAIQKGCKIAICSIIPIYFCEHLCRHERVVREFLKNPSNPRFPLREERSFPSIDYLVDLERYCDAHHIKVVEDSETSYH